MYPLTHHMVVKKGCHHSATHIVLFKVLSMAVQRVEPKQTVKHGLNWIDV